MEACYIKETREGEESRRRRWRATGGNKRNERKEPE